MLSEGSYELIDDQLTVLSAVVAAAASPPSLC